MIAVSGSRGGKYYPSQEEIKKPQQRPPQRLRRPSVDWSTHTVLYLSSTLKIAVFEEKMSSSPPIRRLSSTSNSSRHQEELINAYEAEEERIINLLSRKLEQLRQEKIGLENALEAESESHVNRLSRELSALRIAQHQLQQQGSQANGAGSSAGFNANGLASLSVSPETKIGFKTFMNGSNPADPSAEVMLDAMRRENEQLRGRLVDTEREFVRITRLNEIYREELIDHRRRLGIPLDNLIGMPSSSDPLSQPTHQRRSSFSYSNGSSPSTSVFHHPSLAPRSSHAHAVPIPRPASQVHRPTNHIPSGSSTPLSHSPASSESPFPFSPGSSAANPASFLSSTTNITSPPSSASPNLPPPLSLSLGRGLTYPSVPPPSLSSSFGSPTISFHLPHRDHSLSPIEPLSRRSSNARRGSISRGASRRASLDFGARVAETGSLLPRSRAGSQSLRPTAEALDDHGVVTEDITATEIKISSLDS